MAEGLNDWEWQVGLATHEWKAAEDPVLTGLGTGGPGETLVSGYEGTEPFVAKPTSESPASAEQLMEEVCERANLVRAWKRVRSPATTGSSSPARCPGPAMRRG